METVNCDHAQCSGTDDDGNTVIIGFDSKAELHKHIRKNHKETPFICAGNGCDRKGAKGWFRKHDRTVHQRKEHAFIMAPELDAMNDQADAAMPEYLETLVG